MEVAVEHSGNIRSVGDYGENLGEIELRQPNGDILQGFGTVVGINLYAHVIRCQETQIGRNALVIGKEDIVVLVHFKFLITQHRIHSGKVNTHATLFHLGFQTKSNAESAFVIIHFGTYIECLFVESSTATGIEDILRILAVVAHLYIKTCGGGV